MATSPDKVPRQGGGYAELHAISNFSFLRGASHPEELVRTAQALGYNAIAVTDECSVAGVVKAHLAARELDIKLIVGSEFHLLSESGDIHLVLLAPDRRAYGQLSQLITLARRRAPKGDYALGLEDLRNSVDGCLALWVPGQGPFSNKLLIGNQVKELLPHLWIALELFLERDDLDKTAHVLTLSSRLDLPVVASNGACMHISERQPLRDVLTAIRLGKSVGKLGTQLDQNRERHLRSLAGLAEIYPQEMLDETLTVAERCTFSLDELRYEYPRELVPAGLTPIGLAISWIPGISLSESS
ncbi:MAG: PHP domain-containing protein, partial [Gammaproteobacteria bacterium]|nr:PHP domain-containing protein [Gammaproteobacteria bacterium]